MPHRDIVQRAIGSYKETIDEAISFATTFTLDPLLSLTFNTDTIGSESLLSRVRGLRTGNKKTDARKCAIYVFSMASTTPAERIFDALSSANEQRKADGKKKNLCAVNRDFAGSPTLYVGRSFKPRDRISQHLAASDTATYAMHLDQWAKPLALEIDLHVYDVPQFEDNPTLERAMNVVETGLWDHLRPLLGRRGDK